MTGFLSALGGFAKGLDQSLQKNEAYAQQAKAAKEAREADLFDKRILMNEKFQFDSALKRLDDDNSYNIPGFPFKLNNGLLSIHSPFILYL